MLAERNKRSRLDERQPPAPPADYLQSLPERTRVEQLVRWGNTDPTAIHTQKSLEALWKVTRGAGSTALRYLTQQGY